MDLLPIIREARRKCNKKLQNEIVSKVGFCKIIKRLDKIYKKNAE